jgi:hypothetical protein
LTVAEEVLDDELEMLDVGVDVEVGRMMEDELGGRQPSTL